MALTTIRLEIENENGRVEIIRELNQQEEIRAHDGALVAKAPALSTAARAVADAATLAMGER